MTFDPNLCRNESEVESKLIVQYLLPELGYSPDTWHQEVALGNIRLDFLAFAVQVLSLRLDENSPLSLVIEAKSPQLNLNRYERRLKQYLTKLCVKYGVLTNGKELRIYEKFGNEINLKFQCAGKEIGDKILDIKQLIGRKELKERHSKILQELQNKQIDFVELKDELEQDEALERQSTVKVIAIYHNKGGVGKTTVSVNLAAALSKQGKRVLLIDLDAQANTTYATGLIKFQFEEDDNLKEANVYHLIESGTFNFIPDIARKSAYFNVPEVDVVPSHITLIEHQEKLNQIAVSRTRLVAKLNQVEEQYDIVLIDAPPSRDIYAQIALIAADYLLIPSDLKPFANQGLANVKNLVSDINEYRETIGRTPLKIIGVLPSKISTNSKFLEHSFPKQKNVIPDHYDLPIMDSIIFDRTALSNCVNQTITVGNLEVPDPKSIFEFAETNTTGNQSAQEFENLAVEVLKKMEMI